MPRIRQQNVLAAQWAPNGGALGAPDLTVPDNQVFASNVFSPAIQRQRLPKDVFEKLQGTLNAGDALDLSLADSVDPVKRFEAAGWAAWRIDGHDPKAIAAAL